MRFLAQLLNDGAPVPHQPPLAVPPEDLGGGATLFHEVGGPARQPRDFVQVSHVTVTLDAGPDEVPFSRTLPVLAQAGVVPIRRGATAVLVWRGLDQPVMLAERLEGVAAKVRAAIDAAGSTPSA